MVFSQYGSELWLRTGEHVLLVAIAMLCACAIGIPVGVLLTRVPNLAQLILGLANIMQTIPSLALFGFLIAVPFLGGIGKVPAIVALALYALLPLIRNTYIGIQTVDPAIREAARGMGMTSLQRLFRVEMPLALGVILSGVRVATVMSVGMATIAAAIGGGGLGVLIFRGIATVNTQLIWAGAIPSAGLALLADFALGVLEKQLTRKPQCRHKPAIAIALALALISMVGVLLTYRTAPETIVIGSKNFTEQVILGELLAQQIESKTNLNVDRRFNLGGTLICHEAVKAGKIAGYVEYTGTALTVILKQPINQNPQQVYSQVKQAYQAQFNLDIFPSLGFNNTFALIIRGDEAKRLGIKTLSEAAPYTANWQAGFGPEFVERQDGYPGLAKTYGFQFTKRPKQMELGLMYPALRDKQVDIIAANSTDGLIPALNLVILEDDKAYFPPYEAVPVFHQATLQRHPKLRTTIEQLAGRISTADMQQMNYQVDTQGRTVADVVKEWLQRQS